MPACVCPHQDASSQRKKQRTTKVSLVKAEPWLGQKGELPTGKCIRPRTGPSMQTSGACDGKAEMVHEGTHPSGRAKSSTCLDLSENRGQDLHPELLDDNIGQG